MYRFKRADAFASQPSAKALENVLCAVILERRAFTRQIRRFDHKVRTRSCSVAVHHRHQLGVKGNVADRVLGLNIEMLGRLDSNDVVVPAKRAPFETINLDPAQASSKREHERKKGRWVRKREFFVRRACELLDIDR